jgi:hypothetical protein
MEQSVNRAEAPTSWQAEAFNPVPASENRIHSDEVARAYGFRGALVPGVTISAYLIHPAIVAWGEPWLQRGQARCVVHSPVYDREPFRVQVRPDGDAAYTAELSDPRGTRCATARVALPESTPTPPEYRGDPILERGGDRPIASRETMEALQQSGLRALPVRWDESSELTRYLGDPAEMPGIFRDDRYADPSFVLGISNWVLGANVRMDPWLHLQTESQNHRSIPWGSALVAEAAIVDLFEKKGHEFVDADVDIFFADTLVAAASVRLRAIYRLREPE